MAYILDGTTIRNPHTIKETNLTQVAAQRALNGANNRDYFGSTKRIWQLEYNNAKKAEYDVLKAIYDAYLSTVAVKTWQITETNYPISQTLVHVDLIERGFSVQGSDYISDFTLTLTEA